MLHGLGSGQDVADDTQNITIGTLTIDIAGHRVAMSGQDVSLTLSEFLLLKELATNPYRVLDRKTLAGTLRESGISSDASLRAVDLHISRLRRKLSDAGCDCIKTMRRVGYRFVPDGVARPF